MDENRSLRHFAVISLLSLVLVFFAVYRFSSTQNENLENIPDGPGIIF